MAKITPSMVKELREATGSAMMDCKKALDETNGDIETAKEALRKKGQVIAGKKSGRKTKEGIVKTLLSEEGSSIALIRLACETDFVARNDKFQSFAEQLLKYVLNYGTDDFIQIQTDAGKVSELIINAIAEIGENITFIEAVKWDKPENGFWGTYVHNNNKIGVLVELVTDKNIVNFSQIQEIAKDVAMHVAANQFQSISEKDCPADIIEKERNFLIQQAKESGKPENIIEKMIEGRINKFIKEICLIHQPFVKNPDQTIQQFLEEHSKNLGVKLSISRCYKSNF